MTDIFTITLVGDGSSDANLLPIVNWVIQEHFPNLTFRSEFARFLPPPGAGLKARVEAAILLNPCDVVLVHRDAENQPIQARIAEIETASLGHAVAHTPVVPVRMSEAWLLSDEHAIRTASGNPNGVIPLNLPPAANWETTPDPKSTVFTALKRASGLHGRRLSRFDVHRARNRIAEISTSFAALRTTAAFTTMEQNLVATFTPLPLVQASLY